MVALVVLAYLVGSLSPSVFLGKLVKGIDVRDHGSGNAGTTNAFRVLGTGLGIAVLAGDVLKGFLPVLLAREISTPLATVLAALAAIGGHNWSVFLRGKGGKGVATGAGTLLAMTPLILAALVAVFLAVLVLTRFVSLASLTAVVLFPAFVILAGRSAPYVVFSLVASAVVMFAHRGNIVRLVRRKERRTSMPWHRWIDHEPPS
ncbi:MAG: glycerol-3-phosphate 1-O-acyltransferase PlsY [Thermoleophilia bacterium]|nr:glycerol-3-phosphate 1-O-acyltransferase PlsY [Thermoleophilia bacterium]